MTEYRERTYRHRIHMDDMVSFHVAVKETDLWVSADRDLATETRDLILDCRYQIETYIQSHPEFLTVLEPIPLDPFAPAIVKEMIVETGKAGVGPMASVAGAIAQSVGIGLMEWSDQVIVENGGDIYLKINRAATVSIFAGASPLSETIGLRIPVRLMPLGVCSSSGTVGHSFSRGNADVVCLLAPSTILADGAATALGNRIVTKEDLAKAAQWASGMTALLGGVAVMGDRMATWGDVELVSL